MQRMKQVHEMFVEQPAQAEDYSDIYLFRLATALPAVPTLPHVARRIMDRVARMMQKALQHAQHHTRMVKCGHQQAQSEEEASRWAWLLPTLLLRRTTPFTRQATKASGRSRHQQEVRRIETRVFRAEQGKWRKLLDGVPGREARAGDGSTSGCRGRLRSPNLGG